MKNQGENLKSDSRERPAIFNNRINNKKMYKYKTPTPTTLRVNKGYVGESIEQKINRIVNNKEPITDGAPLIYTERKDGVVASTNIRTDRFEVAVEAMDKVQKAKIAQREERQKSVGEQGKEGMEKESKTETKNVGEAKPLPGTDGTGTSK